MRMLLAAVTMVMLTGCSTIEKWIPSFWDDNQSNYIIQARISIGKIDCEKPQIPQVNLVSEDIKRFELYSQAKGALQKDVLRLVEPMRFTINEWQQRGEGATLYCEMKKKILLQQSERASKVILGRW